MNVAQPQIYEFDDFRIDSGRRLLLQRGVPVPLKPKVFDTLLYLARHQGRVLEKDELMRAVWPDANVEENNLNQNVSTLRRALGESRGENRYIVTVPGRGYRFAATVSMIADEGVAVEGAVGGAPVPSLSPEGATAPPAGAGRSTGPNGPGRLGWAVAGVLAAAFVVSLATAWRGPRIDAVKRPVWLDLDIGNGVSQPAISSDGTTLVFVASGSLAVRKFDQARITPLAGTEGASSPFFSPDGKWVAYFAGHQLRKVAIEGGESVTLCDARFDRGGTWTADGQIIAGLGPSGELSKIPASGGAAVPFSSLKGEPTEVTNHGRPVALPGGKGILFVSGTGPATGILRVLPAAGPAKTLVEGSSTGRYLAGGYLLFDRGTSIFAAPMDLDKLELTGPASPVIEGVAYDHFHGADFDVSDSGTLVYRRGPSAANRAVMWLDSSGVKGRVLARTGAYTSPRLSPDGKRLALSSESEIWIYDLARAKFTQLTFGSQAGCCAVWSPDGAYVAFSSRSGLSWTRWDGSGTVERLPAARGSIAVPWTFSPGRQVADVPSKRAGHRLRSLGGAGGAERQCDAARAAAGAVGAGGDTGGSRDLAGWPVASLRLRR